MKKLRHVIFLYEDQILYKDIKSIFLQQMLLQ